MSLQSVPLICLPPSCKCIHPEHTYPPTCRSTDTHLSKQGLTSFFFFLIIIIPSPLLPFVLLSFFLFLHMQPFLCFCITPPLIFSRCSPAPFIHPDLAFLSIFPGLRHVTLFSALLLPRFPREPFVRCSLSVSLLQHP